MNQAIQNQSGVANRSLQPVQPQPATPAQRAMNMIEDELSQLYNQIESLEQRVAPCLTGNVAEKLANIPAEPPFGGSAIVEKLQQFSNMIRNSRMRLVSISERVEL